MKLQCLCIFGAALFIATLPFSAAVGDDDVIYVARGKNLQLTTKLTGRILDYTGRELTLLVGGTPTSHNAEHVIRVETQLSAEHQAADRLFDEGRFREALAEYTAAGRQEERRWVRRQMMAQMIWCYRQLDDIPAAGDTFLMLLASDPRTIHFDAIPLAWNAVEPAPRLADKCRQWLADQKAPAAGLIGASYLLSTSHSPAATDRLERLTFDTNPHVAQLAEAQLWRVRMVTSGSEQYSRWSQAIERMPEVLRGGPYFIVGQAFARSGDHQQAALHYMRVPILYSGDHALSSRALLAASRSLDRLGQDRQAAGLLVEITSHYPKSPVAAEAQRLLQGYAAPAPSNRED